MNRYDQKIFRTSGSPRKWSNLSVLAALLPALAGVLVICGESTPTMGADHTGVWLLRLFSHLSHTSSPHLGELNHILRKNGHFFGYGMLGLIFARGWLMFLNMRSRETWTRLRVYAGAFGVVSAAIVASLDELHQSFLPNRTACVSDVMLDTSGALLLVTLFTLSILLRRQKAFFRLREVRNYRLWLARITRFEQALRRSTNLSRPSMS